MQLRENRLPPSVAALRAAVVTLCLAAAPGLLAGLRFQPAPAPSGGDVASLAGDGATLWAATSRGVWRLSAGAWTLDGLSDQTLTSIAVAGGSVFAASGDRVYRRAADGTWSAEVLPSSVILPSVVVADGDTLYAGGIGVARRSGSSWTALPSPGSGTVNCAVIDSGTLVVGLNSGTAARLTVNTWTSMSAGFPSGEAPGALASSGGALYAGTSAGFYAWNGVLWLRDSAFGTHDVRAIASSGGVLHVATFDRGVFYGASGYWAPESQGLSTFAGRSLGVLGSSLYLGTSGGPVYTLAGTSWTEAGPGTLNGSTVSDLLTGSKSSPSPADVWVATRGAGVLYRPAIPGLSPVNPVLPDGCGDVRALAFTTGAAAGDVLAATGCGAYAGSGMAWNAASTGLPAAASLLTLASTPSGTVGGSAANGVFRFDGSGWSADNLGLPAAASVQRVRLLGTSFYAALGQGLVSRPPGGSFTDASAGLPDGAIVLGLGGGDPAFAGLLTGGVARRSGASAWRSDSLGLSVASVYSIEVSSGRLFAAAGILGVVVKRDGAWGSETAGLPRGADARVLRDGAGGLLHLGTAGNGAFVASSLPSVRTIPVVLDVVGGTGARFRTELTIGSRSSSDAAASVTFTPAPGFGAPAVPAGSVALALPAGGEIRAADALDFLRARGLPIPAATASSPIAGSLTVAAGAATDDVYAIARTYTLDAGGGSYGLFYDGPSDLEAAEDEATVYGLRSVSGVSRSNLAVVHLPGRGSDPITLNVQVYTASGTAAGAPLQHALQPGEWYQFNNILSLAGLADGSYGYARITRGAGTGAWSAYGVVNDAATSDGSYLQAYRPGGAAAGRKLVVPVVLDVYGAAGSHFTTEVTLANDSPLATGVTLTYKPAPGFGSASGVPNVLTSLAGRAQVTIPDVLRYLRDRGVKIPDGSTGAQAGTLTVEFKYPTALDSARTVALARTSTPNPNAGVGGTFGLFYPAAPKGTGARTSAVVPSLTEDATVRSNLAVVHLGGGSEGPLGLSVQLFDAASGAPAGNALAITLQPGDWFQWSRVLQAAGALGATSKAYAVVTRTSGDDSWLAYGVLNDAVTSDGSYLRMIPADKY